MSENKISPLVQIEKILHIDVAVCIPLVKNIRLTAVQFVGLHALVSSVWLLLASRR